MGTYPDVVGDDDAGVAFLLRLGLKNRRPLLRRSPVHCALSVSFLPVTVIVTVSVHKVVVER